MFAIVCLGNQQFKVKAGDFIRAPFQNQAVEDRIKIPVVAFNSEKDFIVDKSKLKNSKVEAVIVRQSLARKVLVFKKKRRKGYRRTRGHRQKITELKIVELCSPEGEISKVDFKKKTLSKVSDEKALDTETSVVSSTKSQNTETLTKPDKEQTQNTETLTKPDKEQTQNTETLTKPDKEQTQNTETLTKPDKEQEAEKENKE